MCISMRWTNVFNEDVLKYFCYKAAKRLGDSRGCFTKANFAHVVLEERKSNPPLDGDIVEMILVGRAWLRRIDGSLYQIILPLQAQQTLK